jgi:hypothetical protein
MDLLRHSKRVLQRDITVNSRNVIYSKYTSGNGQFLTEAVILIYGLSGCLPDS